MFSVTVRDHLMVAHSLRGEVFGPAQRLHGATFVVDATFRSRELGPDGIVLDIGRATAALHEVLADLGYRNLDDHPDFAGVNTTTEVLARHVADELVDRARSGDLGDLGGAGDPGVDPGVGPTGRLVSVAVTLHESHVAWASYERAP